MPTKKVRHDCASYEVCQDLRNLLLKFKVPKGELTELCDTSDATWPCSAMLHYVRQLYDNISPSNATEVLEFITPLFAKREQLVSSRFDQHSGDAPFHCPELDVDMYQPCLTTSCAFHTADPWALNCILFYRLRYERDTLNLNELSFLLNKEVGVLRSILNRTFRQLSQGALKETIARDGDSELVLRVHSDNVCVVCEHKIEARRKTITKSGFTYCSKGCATYKPPQVIRMEQEFELPIERVLDLCVQRFSSVKNMCAALGVGPSVFSNWCDRYSVIIPPAKISK